MSLLGWEQVISYLEQLNGLGVCAAVDCGISIDSLQTLDSSSDLRGHVQELFLTNQTFKITSACPVMGKQLTHLFDGAFAPSPLLMDVDGPSVQREPDRLGEPLKVLLACTLSEDFVVNPEVLESELKELQVKYNIGAQQLLVPSAMLKPLQECLSSLTLDTHQIFELKNCRKDQHKDFDHVILFRKTQEQDDSLLKNLEWQTISRAIPVSLLSSDVQQRLITDEQFNLQRPALYFNASIQKQVAHALDLLNSLLSSSQLFRRVLPL